MKSIFPFSIRRHGLSMCVVLGITGLILTVFADSLFNRQLHTAFKEISRGPLKQNRIALTFDAGGGINGLEKLLAALKDARIHCTIFLTGQWASKHPELVREILSEGHEIGNHSWSHPDLTQLDDARIRSEIEKTDALLV